MGSSFSQAITDAKERDGKDFIVTGIKIKSKEASGLVKKLNQELPELQVLEVRSKLKAIPNNISILSKIEVIRLNENKLTALPKEIADCQLLTELDLSSNAFQRLPPEIALISSLKQVNFTSNQLSTFPAPKTNKDFYSLDKLILEKNQFVEFPKNICALVGLQVLNLNENDLTIIPAGDFGNLVNLRELYVRRNQITEIPTTISKLRQLVTFDCSENKISQLPTQIASLGHLQTFEIQHNCLSVISDELCSLTSLTTLKLHDNNISVLPSSISNLSCLNELYLQENQISSLPKEIGKLVNLRKLYLEYNRLSSIPEEIGELKKLVILILHNNQLATLPFCIASMTSLLRLSLDHNPFKDPTILKIIQEEGALALIQRELPIELTGGSSGNSLSNSHSTTDLAGNRGRSALTNTLSSANKYGTLQRRTLHRDRVTTGREFTRSSSIASLNESQALANATNHPPPANNPPPASSSSKREDLLSSKKKKDSKVKDSEASVPSYSHFKFEYESLLEQQDFSKKKKEMLKKLSDQEKWSLLAQYKGSTLQLLKEQPKPKGGSKKDVTNKSAVDFVVTLKEGRVNKNVMMRTKSSFKQSKVAVSKFIEAGGIPALCQFVQTTAAKKVVSARDHSSIKDCLDIFEILLNVSLKSVLTNSAAVTAIAIPLTLDDANNKYFSIRLLEDICSKELHIGAQLVLEAIKTSSNQTAEFRFYPLIQCLLPESESSTETKSSSLSLINQIINSVHGLEERFELRTEFLRMGLQGILAQLKSNKIDLIQMEREIFDEETSLDYEDMRCRFNRKDVIEKILSASPDGSLTIAVFTGSIQCSHSIALDADISVHEIIQQIVKKFVIENAEDYGLCIRSEDVNKDDTWLELDKLFAECVSPELASQVEFRMMPWKLVVDFPNGSTRQFLLDPNITCEQAVQIISSTNQLPPADYCLMLLDQVLPEASSLNRTSLSDIENRSKVLLRVRPLRLRVTLTEDIWQMMEFDPEKEVTAVFKQIADHIGRAFSPDKFNLTMESPDLPEPVILEEGKLMKDYVMSENCSLRFVSKGNVDETTEEEEECNIWEEAADSPDNITFERNKEKAIQYIESATLNKLVERVTSPEEYDVDFSNVFTMMYSAFTTPELLWKKLVERFRVPASHAASKQKIQVRVCTFIKNWVEKVGGELAGTELKQNILSFLEEELTDPGFAIFANAIRVRINNPREDDSFVANNPNNAKPPIPYLPKNIMTVTLSIHDIEEIEIARQLTLQTFDIYKKIRPPEFFKLAWNSAKLKHKCPNVSAIVDHYNRVASAFASIIVMTDTVRERTKTMQKVIDIAVQLKELNNFHLLSAFVSAINNSAVDRLKFTQARISRRHRQSLEEIEAIMGMEGSFKCFRERLVSAAPPCIPFMGVYLTDLIFIDEGNPNKFDKRINFGKQKLVHGVISRIQAYQTIGYTLDSVDSIQQFIKDMPTLGEKELYAQSLKIEPRGATRAEIL